MMVYTVCGFNQPDLINYGLDLIDAEILRYIINFRDGGDMKRMILDGCEFYWVSYKKIMEDLPILGITTRQAMAKRMMKFVDAGLMGFHLEKHGGTYTYYSLNHDKIQAMRKKPEGGIQNERGAESKTNAGRNPKRTPAESKINAGRNPKRTPAESKINAKDPNTIYPNTSDYNTRISRKEVSASAPVDKPNQRRLSDMFIETYKSETGNDYLYTTKDGVNLSTWIKRQKGNTEGTFQVLLDKAFRMYDDKAFPFNDGAPTLPRILSEHNRIMSYQSKGSNSAVERYLEMSREVTNDN